MSPPTHTHKHKVIVFPHLTDKLLFIQIFTNDKRFFIIKNSQENLKFQAVSAALPLTHFLAAA